MIPIALTPKTIGIAFVVLAVAGLGTYVTILKGQRDGLRERVAGLEHQLELERSEYEHSKAEWNATLEKVEAAFAEANRKRLAMEAQLGGLRDALEVNQRIARERGLELERLRSAAIQSPDCCEAWNELLAAVGWAEGDM